MTEAQQAVAEPQETSVAVVADANDTGKFAIQNTELRKTLRQLGNFVEKTRREIAEAESDFERTFLQSELVVILEEQMDEHMVARLKKLENNPYGFKTDSPEGYDDETVKRVAIAAFMAGLRVVGNEMNIISGQLYPTREGFERLLREMPGFRNFDWAISASEKVVTGKTKKGIDYGEARFTAIASWTMNGKKQEVRYVKRDDGDFRIVVKHYGSDTEDLLRGKAESKLFRRIYKRVAGFDPLEWQTDEIDDDDAIDVTATRVETPEEPADDSPIVEAEHQTAKQLMDRAEKWVDLKLKSCDSLIETNKIHAEAMKLIQDNGGGCSEDEITEIQEYVTRLCDAWKEQIKSNRGERSTR